MVIVDMHANETSSEKQCLELEVVLLDFSGSSQFKTFSPEARITVPQVYPESEAELVRVTGNRTSELESRNSYV